MARPGWSFALLLGCAATCTQPPNDAADHPVSSVGAPPAPAANAAARDRGADLASATGTLLGRVSLHGQSAALFNLSVRDDNAFEHSLEIGADGTFELTDVAPGRYELRANHVAHWSCPGKNLGYAWTVSGTVAEVHAGVVTEVEVDAGTVGFSSVHGRVLVDEEAQTGWLVTLCHLDSGTRYGTFEVAPDGSYASGSVLPGRYRVELSRTDHPEECATLEHVFYVSANAQAVHDFLFTPRRLVLALRGVDGLPLEPSTEFQVWAGESTWVVGATDGKVTLDPAPELPVSVRRWNVGHWFSAGQMPQDCRDHTASVVVPAK